MATLGIILLLINLPVTAYIVVCWMIDGEMIATGNPPRFSPAACLFHLVLVVAGYALIIHLLLSLP